MPSIAELSSLIFDQIVNAVLILFAALFSYGVALKAMTSPLPVIKRFKKEFFFEDASGKQFRFPSFDSEPELELSVIIPAYDEEKRLPVMLDECMGFLEKKQKENNTFTYEVIVVNDGSKDKTVETAMKYCEKYTSNKFRVLDLIENRGKGGAVRLGMQSARGRFLLFADADGATKFSDYNKLELSLHKLCRQKNNILPTADEWKVQALSIGSRAHLEKESTAKRSLFRTILMHGFHVLVWLFTVRNVKDTQCGFKLLTRSAATIIFQKMHVEKWAFDVELLYIAQKYGMLLDEIPVNWTEIDGSKLTPLFSSIQMGRDLFLIWFKYKIRVWKC